MQRWTAAVVTSSDGVAHGAREDTSGDALALMLAEAGFEVALREVVPDDRPTIAGTLERLADRDAIRLIVVTGGTGFAPRDVTPEATRDVVDREAPGLAEAMRAAGRASTPMADLSRAVCGIRGGTIVVNVPGSTRGATESLEAVIGLLPHALTLLDGDTAHPGGAPPPATDVEEAAAAAVGHDHRRDHRHDHAHGQPDEHASHDPTTDPACAAAHGHGPASDGPGTLVAVYDSPVARHLLHFGRDLGYRTVLVDPTEPDHRYADAVVASTSDLEVDDETDIVVTDHDAADLAEQIAPTLSSSARYIGLMGSSRHDPPHVAPLRERGFDDAAIARVRRPIGLDIGSKTPPEIALATLAGLVAIRRGRTGGLPE